MQPFFFQSFSHSIAQASVRSTCRARHFSKVASGGWLERIYYPKIYTGYIRLSIVLFYRFTVYFKK